MQISHGIKNEKYEKNQRSLFEINLQKNEKLFFLIFWIKIYNKNKFNLSYILHSLVLILKQVKKTLRKKIRLTFSLSKRSKQLKYGRWRWSNLRGTNILPCLRRKSIRNYLLSSNDDDDDDDDDNDEMK